MKIRFRRLLSLVLTVVMLCSLLPMTAMAGGDFFEYGDFMCEFWQDEETGQRVVDIAAYVGGASNLVIPNRIQGVSVRSVQIMYNETLTNLTIPEGVETVNCSGCSALQRIDLPGTLKGIGGDAFNGCTSLTDIVLPEGMTYIALQAFWDCTALQKINLPASLTELGMSAFCGCSALTTVSVPENSQLKIIGDQAFSDCSSLTSFRIPDGVTEIGSMAFSGCELLTSIRIPDGVTEIGSSPFAGCTSLEAVELPDSVASMGDFVFNGCTALKAVKWPSACDTIGRYAMNSCNSLTTLIIPASVKTIESSAIRWCDKLTDVYYGGTEEEWRQINIESGNDSLKRATIHFSDEPAPDLDPVPEPDDGFGPQFRVESHDTLAELTTEDYLAFSAISYLDFGVGKTVEEALKEKGCWKAKWQEDLGITYEKLCSPISGWHVKTKYNFSNLNGFSAYTFTNAGGEAVIAYRGSIPVDEWGNHPADAVYDWFVNDLPIELGNILGPQFGSALVPYLDLADKKDPSQIAVTGHSLGGAWADVVSATYGCRGVSFNAVSVLDTLFMDKPEMMAKVFRGTDQWNFVDHTNQYDLLAGMYEHYITTQVKPYIAHKGNVSISQAILKQVIGQAGGFLTAGIGNIAAFLDIVACHGLRSLVTLDSKGNVVMTEVTSSFKPESAVSSEMATRLHTVNLGTTKTDHMQPILGVLGGHTSFGGNSFDLINGSIYGDILVGGGSDDNLDGSWGNDVYIHAKGDNADIIHDAAGNDTLRLEGYENGDSISVYEALDSEYILVKCNNQIIAQISKKNREYTIASLDRFKIVWGWDEYDITEAFERFSYGEHLYVACPVSVEILDGEGNVVYTVRDGEVGNFYTDYGSFYVFAQENGEYAKVLDVREGYTARIIGLDEGTMDVSYQKPVNGVLTDPVMRTDIPVTKDTTAVFVEGEDGKVNLEMDTDGDGNADESIPLRGQNPFADVSEDQWYAEPVLWAVDEGITSGTTPTTFSPDGTCTRAQVVTFLWAANGRPEPKSMENPFVDVADDAWYLKPVLWAVENGITTGVSSTEFGPENTCTRAQIVTFLYAAAGKPDVSGESTFSDVSNDAWYLKPILWAAQNDVTGGIGEGLFGPENTCTRAQVVTFLYKVYGS